MDLSKSFPLATNELMMQVTYFFLVWLVTDGILLFTIFYYVPFNFELVLNYDKFSISQCVDKDDQEYLEAKNCLCLNITKTAK